MRALVGDDAGAASSRARSEEGGGPRRTGARFRPSSDQTHACSRAGTARARSGESTPCTACRGRRSVARRSGGEGSKPRSASDRLRTSMTAVDSPEPHLSSAIRSSARGARPRLRARVSPRKQRSYAVTVRLRPKAWCGGTRISSETIEKDIQHHVFETDFSRTPNEPISPTRRAPRRRGRERAAPRIVPGSSCSATRPETRRGAMT